MIVNFIKSGEEMYRKLAETQLYNLKNGKFIKAELESYKCVLDGMWSKLEVLFGNGFIATCDNEGLQKFERLLGLAESGFDVDGRRDMVKYRLSIKKNDYNCEGLQRAIRSAGLDAEIISGNNTGQIVIKCNGIFDGVTDYERIKNEVKKLLPAHLEVVIDMGTLDWKMLDDKDMTFSQFDAEDFTWGTFDLSGHMIGNGGI